MVIFNRKRKRDENHFGTTIKRTEGGKGLTQKEIAEKFQIHSVTYLHYEKAQREPPLSLLADFAVFFGVSVDYLLGLEN